MSAVRPARRRQIEWRGSTERLEARLVLTAPALTTFSNTTLLSGSTLHVPINASDLDGDVLTFTVTSSNPGIIVSVTEGNRSLEVDVENFGTMTFQLFEDLVPRATDHIITLAESGFYNGSIVHEVTSAFIESGDPNGSPPGTGGSPLGTFDDQFHPDLQHNRSGVLSLVKLPSGSQIDDTSDSQFAILDAAARSRDFNNTIVGQLVTGDSVRGAISAVATNAGGRPLTDVVINSVDVINDLQNGLLRLSAAEGFSGTATIGVTVSDGVDTDFRIFTVTAQPDPENSDPYLAGFPKIRTLVDQPTTFQSPAVDVENELDQARYLDEDELSMRGLAIPAPTPANVDFSVDFVTGAATFIPSGGTTGTKNVTVAIRESNLGIDYQIVPVEIVASATPLAVSSADHPEGDFSDDGVTDVFRVVRNGTRIEVFHNDTLTAQAEVGSVSLLAIDGSDDDDQLIIDWSGGNPIPAGGFVFVGAGQVTAGGDTMTMIGANSASVTHQFTVPGNGVVLIDGLTVTYSGTETITDTLTAVNRTLEFGDAADVVTLSDDDTPGNGRNRLTGSIGQLNFRAPSSGLLTVAMGGGNDQLNFTSQDGTFDMTVYGGAGDDTITAGDGNDRVFGEDGNDVINGGFGSDTLIGQAGDDILLGGAGGDRLEGRDGNDSLDGQGSNDTLLGDLGNDTLHGGTGDLDRIIEGAADVFAELTATSYSGAGTDVISEIEYAVIIGDDGPNNIDAALFSGSVEVRANGGDDTVRGSLNGDLINGGDGNDSLNGYSGPDTMFGDLGDDSLRGGAQIDLLFGGEGNDSVDGQGSSGDSVSGGPGNDTISGGAGNDVIYELDADANIALFNDHMTGLGDDVVQDVERAFISGGAGNNRIDVSNFLIVGFTTTTLYGAGGNDTLIGSLGNDQLRGDDGDDSMDAGEGNDYLAGGAGRDTLIGGAGNDRLRGQGGSGDRLTGGDGADDLDGGAGNDFLVEAVTENVLIYRTNRYETSVRTRIRDLETFLLFGDDSSNLIDASGYEMPVLIRAFGAGGNDTLIGSPGIDSLVGGEGGDLLIGNGGDDTLQGGEGSDTLQGEDGDDALSGGPGNDSLYGDAGLDTLYGGSGNDRLLGAAQNDILIGGAGADYIDGQGSSADTVAGGSGNDSAEAGDTVLGSASEIDEFFQLDPVPSWVEEV